MVRRLKTVQKPTMADIRRSPSVVGKESTLVTEKPFKRRRILREHDLPSSKHHEASVLEESSHETSTNVRNGPQDVKKDYGPAKYLPSVKDGEYNVVETRLRLRPQLAYIWCRVFKTSREQTFVCGGCAVINNKANERSSSTMIHLEANRLLDDPENPTVAHRCEPQPRTLALDNRLQAWFHAEFRKRIAVDKDIDMKEFYEAFARDLPSHPVLSDLTEVERELVILKTLQRGFRAFVQYVSSSPRFSDHLRSMLLEKARARREITSIIFIKQPIGKKKDSQDRSLVLRVGESAITQNRNPTLKFIPSLEDGELTVLETRLKRRPEVAYVWARVTPLPQISYACEGCRNVFLRTGMDKLIATIRVELDRCVDNPEQPPISHICRPQSRTSSLDLRLRSWLHAKFRNILGKSVNMQAFYGAFEQFLPRHWLLNDLSEVATLRFSNRSAQEERRIVIANTLRPGIRTFLNYVAEYLHLPAKSVQRMLKSANPLPDRDVAEQTTAANKNISPPLIDLTTSLDEISESDNARESRQASDASYDPEIIEIEFVERQRTSSVQKDTPARTMRRHRYEKLQRAKVTDVEDAFLDSDYFLTPAIASD